MVTPIRDAIVNRVIISGEGGGGVTSLNALTGGVTITSEDNSVDITVGVSTIDLSVSAGGGIIGPDESEINQVAVWANTNGTELAASPTTISALTGEITVSASASRIIFDNVDAPWSWSNDSGQTTLLTLDPDYPLSMVLARSGYDTDEFMRMVIVGFADGDSHTLGIGYAPGDGYQIGTSATGPVEAQTLRVGAGNSDGIQANLLFDADENTATVSSNTAFRFEGSTPYRIYNDDSILLLQSETSGSGFQSILLSQDHDGTDNVIMEVVGSIDFPTALLTLATTGPLDGSPAYDNGASGVGAKLTSTTDISLVVDGDVALLGDTILVKDELDEATNGAYLVTGKTATTYELTRLTNYDTTDEITLGTFFHITDGSDNIGTNWEMDNADPITVGTTPITFASGGGAGHAMFVGYLAGGGYRIQTFNFGGSPQPLQIGDGSGAALAFNGDGTMNWSVTTSLSASIPLIQLQSSLDIETSAIDGDGITFKVWDNDAGSYLDALAITPGDPPTIDLADFSTVAGGQIIRELGRATNIDATSTGTTNIYTVPAGKTAIVTGASVVVENANTVTVEPTAGVGVNGGADDMFAPTLLTGLDNNNTTYFFPAAGSMAIGGPGDIIKFGVDIGATASQLLVTVIVLGYLI